MDRSVPQPRSHAPRLYHKKSRKGCQRCKARRVKCDEKRPACANCHRHGVPCIYEDPTVTSTSETGSEPIPPADQNDVNIFDIPESKSRRVLELRLLHNYMTNLSQPFPVPQSEDVTTTWSVEVPKLAFQNDNLQYAMLATSACHLLRAEPNNPELVTARQNYSGLALREQRKAVAQLSSQNADAVCFTSTMLMIDAFATLQDRVLEPYLPLTEWLQMGRGAGAVFSAALNNVKDSQTSKIMPIVNGPPMLSNDTPLLSEDNRKTFGTLLDRLPKGQGTEEMWETETRAAYEKTLSYVAWVQNAISDDEPIFAICRRLVAFALFVPKKFIELVELQRPRALVVLAHYFALFTKVQSVWWAGNTAQREIRGLQKLLPPEWQDQMRWPLAMAGLTPLEGEL